MLKIVFRLCLETGSLASHTAFHGAVTAWRWSRRRRLESVLECLSTCSSTILRTMKVLRFFSKFLLISWLALSTCFGKVSNSFEAKIHRHKSLTNRALVDKLGTLTFDDANRRLTFSDESHDNFDIPYDGVTKVVFDVNTHMRGGVWPAVLAAGGFPGMIAGAAIAGGKVHDYWMLVKNRNGEDEREVLLEVPKETSKQIIDKATSIFGQKVSVTDFHDNLEKLDPDKLADIKSRHTVKVDKDGHPLPEIRSDKATVVVVCVPLAARNAGRGNQFKFHANDRVIAVNKAGTYSFAYLDPGKYRLISQSENANGFEMQLEAGNSYYFLQNILQGGLKPDTLLTRNSQELVQYLMDGSYWADWKRK
jgi:hypothetical protein